MNLLDLMLKEEVEWPVGAEYATQDKDGWIAFYDKSSKPFIYDRAPAWSSDGGFLRDTMVRADDLALDWSTRIITESEYDIAKKCAKVKPAKPILSHLELGFSLQSGPADAATAKQQSVDATLTERGNRYGKFKDHAELSQKLKEAMYCADGWEYLSADMREALEMIQHKIARILNGDPTYADSWHDIAGYAKLVDDRLNGVER